MRQILSLNGDWNFRQPDDTDSLPARVPGCVHLDLLAAERIEDPFYRDNEDRLHWIGETDWIYSRTFDLPEEILKQERILLRCEGLDTLATVTINGHEVGRANNMFRIWEFDVREALQEGENRIEVRFDSAMVYVKDRQAKAKQPVHGGGGNRTIHEKPWLRKESCNFGWDWGPIAVTCGIWRDIEIVAFSQARLGAVHIQQDHGQADCVFIDVSARAEPTNKQSLGMEVAVSIDGKEVAREEANFFNGRARTNLQVPEPQIWWPNGMGKQPLYEVRVDLVEESGSSLDTVTQRIGLRDIKLVREKDEWGESFRFEANGVPFFAKGANWIPADAFAPRISRERYADLLQSAADANMNMLRVWGGGIYEEDVFYDLCDELGLCVWQDFMFACATYPSFDEDFMENVEAEALDNIRRLRHHPCLALWCGNNELEQGSVGDVWTWHDMSWDDYKALFDDLLGRLVREHDPETDYWPSSPHSPACDRKDYNNPGCGDAHLWSVWHGKQPFEWYRTTTHRFCSEFGFQSFPEPLTVQGFTQPEDRNITAYVMEHHQRSGIGNTTIMQYLLDWFRLPGDFEMTLWLSQITQGMAMKYAIEHWRRNMPRSMGALYWQLNDCWPVASWASIDYHNRWKALHYMARLFFDRVLVSGVEDLEKGTVDVHITSDILEALQGDLLCVVTSVGGETLLEKETPIKIAPNSSHLVHTLDLRRLIEERGVRDLVVWLELKVDGKVVSTNLVHFARPKHLELQDPRFAAAFEKMGERQFRLSLLCEAPALWTWIEIEGCDARLTDNFFHLRPGVRKELVIETVKPLDEAKFRERLHVRSLVDTY